MLRTYLSKVNQTIFRICFGNQNLFCSHNRIFALIVSWGLRTVWIFMNLLMSLSAMTSLVKTCPPFILNAYDRVLGDDASAMYKIRIGVTIVGLGAVSIPAFSSAHPANYYYLIGQV